MRPTFAELVDEALAALSPEDFETLKGETPEVVENVVRWRIADAKREARKRRKALERAKFAPGAGTLPNGMRVR